VRVTKKKRRASPLYSSSPGRTKSRSQKHVYYKEGECRRKSGRGIPRIGGKDEGGKKSQIPTINMKDSGAAKLEIPEGCEGIPPTDRMGTKEQGQVRENYLERKNCGTVRCRNGVFYVERRSAKQKSQINESDA